MKDRAFAVWNGKPTDGNGTISTASGALLGTRYGEPGEFTGAVGPTCGRLHLPCGAELIAAAHAASFSRALSVELTSVGLVSERIATTVTVTSEVDYTGWTVTAILIDVVARVPAASIGDFICAAMIAKTKCAVCRLLNANVSLNARLER